MRRSVLLTLALGAGCASVDRLPDPILNAARVVAPEGAIRIEVDAEGRVKQVSAEITLAQVPQSVKDAAEREKAAGRILRCERCFAGESSTYAITKVVQALRYVIQVDGSGRLLRTESEVPPARTPQIILDSGNQAAPGGSIESVMEVREGDRLEYRIRKRVSERYFLILVGSGGNVREIVREIPASLRSPASTGSPEPQAPQS